MVRYRLDFCYPNVHLTAAMHELRTKIPPPILRLQEVGICFGLIYRASSFDIDLS